MLWGICLGQTNLAVSNDHSSARIAATETPEGEQLPDSLIHLSWEQETEVWINESKTKYQFDEQGRSVGHVEFSWSEEVQDWQNDEKQELTLDAKGNELQLVNFDWDSSSDMWINVTKMITSYDAEGRPLTGHDYGWDAEQNQWVNSWKFEDVYDEAGHLLQRLDYSWLDEHWYGTIYEIEEYDEGGNKVLSQNFRWDDEAREWIKWGRTVYTYSNGLPTQSTTSFWDTSLSQWVFSRRSSETYNDQGLVLESVNERWNSEGWYLDSKSTNGYDEEGNLLTYTWSRWDRLAGDWSIIRMEEKTYDDRGNLLLDIDSGSNHNVSKEESTYNANDLQTSFIQSEWNIDTEEWVLVSKWEKAFNNQGQQLEHLKYTWDVDNGEWIGTEAESAVYEDHHKLQETTYSWDSETSDWVFDGQTNYYRTEPIITDVALDVSPSLVLYPNPSSSYVWINGIKDTRAILQITDVQGRELITEYVENDQGIDLSSLLVGQYIYRLLLKDDTQTGHLIIE